MAKLKLRTIVGANRKESIDRKLALALGLAKPGGDALDAPFIQSDNLPM